MAIHIDINFIVRKSFISFILKTGDFSRPLKQGIKSVSIVPPQNKVDLMSSKLR